MFEYGFWTDLKDLQDEYPEATFGYLENELQTHGCTPYTFLHGCCDIFAMVLHEKYGYKLEYAEWLGLVHAYCVAEHNGETFYIDVRGISTDYEEFMKEFEDVMDKKKVSLFRTDTIPDRYIYKSPSEINKELCAAKAIIREYEYYDLLYCLKSSCYMA